jgi:hypothetical protein
MAITERATVLKQDLAGQRKARYVEPFYAED